MAKRGRRPNTPASSRLILGDSKVRLGMDKDMDALFHRIQALPRGTKFRTVCAWLISGARMESYVPPDELEEIRQSAQDVVDNFVV